MENNFTTMCVSHPLNLKPLHEKRYAKRRRRVTREPMIYIHLRMKKRKKENKKKEEREKARWCENDQKFAPLNKRKSEVPWLFNAHVAS